MTEMCVLKHIAFILVSSVMENVNSYGSERVLWVCHFRKCYSDILLRGSECTLKCLRSLSESA